MDRVTRKVLLITRDSTDADLIMKVLAEARDGSFDMRWVSNLSDGLEQLSKSGIDAILLKLSRAHGDGIEVFDKLFLAAPQIPILVMGDSDDEDIGRQAVQHGADDYLLKDYINGYTLPQALRNAIERRAAENTLFMERYRAQVTLDSIGDAVLSTDILGWIYPVFADTFMMGKTKG